MNKKSKKGPPPIDEEPRHKKKSSARGLPRSKHKHIYKTVLLKRYYTRTDFKTGKPVTASYECPTKVCSICGRIDCSDLDPSYYVYAQDKVIGFLSLYSKDLSEKALQLPKWYVEDYFGKFAVEGVRSEEP